MSDWEVEVTDQFIAWFDELARDNADAVSAAIDELAARGPTLGRPLVDRIHSSRHQNMKELRAIGVSNVELRVLFAFDPRRTAILLLGGNKTGQWNSWYVRAVSEADFLYDQHLKELEEEGLLE